MLEPKEVRAILDHAPTGWVDTKEQAQLRACFIETLLGLNDVDTVRICYDLTVLIRDQLMTNAAALRRSAALAARQDGMSPKDLAEATGLTPQTIARLLTESRK